MVNIKEGMYGVKERSVQKEGGKERKMKEGMGLIRKGEYKIKDRRKMKEGM